MSETPDAPISEALQAAVKPGVSEPLISHETVQNASPEQDGGTINLDALLDVPVTLSVEIGRSKVPIKQLVSLNQGSVIELDRGVNEPLDLLVNGKLMARGEVVVVDGQFGLRLIDIVSPPERLKNLK